MREKGNRAYKISQYCDCNLPVVLTYARINRHQANPSLLDLDDPPYQEEPGRPPEGGGFYNRSRRDEKFLRESEQLMY